MALLGEPGIGKTRTAREFAAYTESNGAQVAWGRCHQAQGTPPYWPWIQIIRSLIQDNAVEQWRPQMGAGAADIAEIVPEVRERIPGLIPPPALEPHQARFRLFDSITTFLRRISGIPPFLIVLDNLHWADQSSLHLLELVAQEIADSPVLLLVSYRDTKVATEHPLTHTLGALSAEPFYRSLRLGGLSEDEVGRFIQTTLDSTPPPDLVSAFHTQTEGNPLFMTQMVRLLVQERGATPEDSINDSGWNIQVPAEVHGAIQRRLNQLSHHCVHVLTTASVVGREFELKLLELNIVEQTGDELL